VTRNWRAAVVVLAALAVWALPAPAGVEASTWRLFAIFAATIVGLVAQPLPMGAVVLAGSVLAALVGAVPVQALLSGFANATVWLVVAAFFFARAFVVTGLGRRIAYLLIGRLGRSTLGLAYAVALADLVVAPATPSNTARAGGILYPIVRSLAAALGSEPGPTARRAGTFLVVTEYQCNVVTSAMFMTAMAASPLAVELAAGVGVVIPWGTWALAGLAPGLLSLALVPALLFVLARPEVTKTPEAPAIARAELTALGRLKRSEAVLLAVFAGLLALWATSQLHGLDATLVALVGVAVLLGTGVLGWDDVLGETKAWDALVWFGGLVMMAGQLNEQGLMGLFGSRLAAGLDGWPWLAALLVLALIYLYSHYAFASMTAHVTALYPVFLATAIAGGSPPLLAALVLAMFSNLNGSLTHYAGGPAPIYFGSGYVSLAAWWRLGFVVSVVNVVIWLGLGLPYWKLLGLW
jgi:DASS family divalent anion:Na+ symporter